MGRRPTNTQLADFDNICAADLRSDDKMGALYLEAVRRGFWPNDSGAVLEFWTMAEKALYEDKHGTPGKLFYSLIKRKDPSKANDAMEQRAGNRVSSIRHTLIDQAAELDVVKRTNGPKLEHAEVSELLFGRNIGFHHGIMVQCFLPQQPFQGTVWEAKHGHATLLVQAGHINDRKSRNLEERSIPSGSKPRLILPYITGYAVRHNSPEIDMGESLRRFLSELGLSIGGKQGLEIVRQIENLAVANITLGYSTEKQVSTKKVSISEGIDFWLEQDEEQNTFWRPSMTLNPSFFDALREHRVPIDMDHLVKLSRSPRRQDLYVWLNYRLPKLRKPLMMPWSTLQDVFGQSDYNGIVDPYKFRQTFKGDLKRIRDDAYDGFKVEPKKDHVLLLPSKSAVPHKVTRFIPKAKSAG